MANMMEYKGTLFDDYVVTDEYNKWVPICERCVKRSGFENESLDSAGSGYCGVRGCWNEADYYLDLEEEE